MTTNPLRPYDLLHSKPNSVLTTKTKAMYFCLYPKEIEYAYICYQALFRILPKLVFMSFLSKNQQKKEVLKFKLYLKVKVDYKKCLLAVVDLSFLF